MSVEAFTDYTDLQNAYEMGLIAQGEYEKQRDILLSGKAPVQDNSAASKTNQEADAPAPQQQPSVPEEDFQEGIHESPVDSNGVKTVTEYRLNDKGQRVKIVRTVKLEKRQTKVKKSVLARRQIPKFGRCAGKPTGPEPGVTSFADLVYLEVPAEEKKKVEKKEASLNYTVSCRSCGAVGDHWTMQCPYKDRLLDVDDLLAGGDGAAASGADGATETLSRGGAGKYRPPGARDGGSAGTAMLPEERAREISTTIRVTNLSEDTSEQDVRDLFSRFGNLQRVYLARNKVTQVSRGFAFISFYNRRDAEKAMEQLQGHGYDNLILRLEFSVSTSNPTRTRDRE